MLNLNIIITFSFTFSCPFQQNNKKRKAFQAFKDEDEYIYGIVTTGTTWYYIKFDTTGIEQICLAQKDVQDIELYISALDDDTILKKQVRDVIGAVGWLLQDKIEDIRKYKRNKKN